MKKRYILGGIILSVFTFCIVQMAKGESIQTSANIAETKSNQKIGWGIKRNDNHEQPDLGNKNKQIIDNYNGIAMGNKESKKVYLSFDEGYEAGYTEKILEVLKNNDVKATFFITAHYVNTQPALVQKMIEEGHIVGNHIPRSLMSENFKAEKV